MSTKKTGEEKGLSIAGQFTQADIPNMLEGINKEISKIKGEVENRPRITGVLGNFGKIQDIKDPDVLRGAYAYITKKGEGVDSFTSVFKKVSPVTEIGPYKEGGATVAQWQEEILHQYREVTYKEQLEKLEKAKQILQDNLSAEAKLAASLEDVARLLKVK